jgi:hypothetical protein
MPPKKTEIYTKNEVEMMNLVSDVKIIKETIDKCYAILKEDYYTKDEIQILKNETDNEVEKMRIQLELVQKIVYGLVGLILTGVAGGMLSYYINVPK